MIHELDILYLKNTGTDAATNISLTIYKSLGTSATNDSRLGYIDTSSVMYTIYNGVPTIVDPMILSLSIVQASVDGLRLSKTTSVYVVHTSTSCR